MKFSLHRIAVISLLVLATPRFLASQEQTIPKLVESVDIRVINIDVVVTDQKGKPVTGLGIGDFEIYENRTQQKITNFYAVEGSRIVEPAPAGAAVPTPATPVLKKEEEVPPHLRRRYVFFIDNLSLAPFNRNKVFKSMKSFARKSVRPGDEAMIATWNRSMKVRLPFTSDIVNIEQTLDAIAGENSFGLQGNSEKRSIEERIREAKSFDEAIVTARTYAQSVEHDVRQTVQALNGLLQTLAGVEGKKVLVLTSEGLPIQPGKEMFFYIEDLRRERPTWQGAHSSLVSGMSFNSTNLIDSIARTANANAVTVYTIHAGGLQGGTESSAEHAKPLGFTARQAEISNTRESLVMLASMTGGTATVGTSDFQGAFDKIDRDLASYYSLGYRSGTERVDRQRSVDVRTKNRKYTVRSRKTFVEKSIPSELNDRVVANLFYESRANDMKIVLTTGRPTLTEERLFRVPIEVRIPMENLTFIPQGEINASSFSVFIVVANKDGDMSDVKRQTHQIRLDNAELAKIKGKHYTYSVELLTEKGRNKISVGLVDDVSNMMGFEQRDVLSMNLQ